MQRVSGFKAHPKVGTFGGPFGSNAFLFIVFSKFSDPNPPLLLYKIILKYNKSYNRIYNVYM